MTHDQAAADRERIAGEMQKRVPCNADEFGALGSAVAAFEVLCEAKNYVWWCTLVVHDGRPRRIWWARSMESDGWYVCIDGTGNHAADVCRLICEVLDREAKEAPR